MPAFAVCAFVLIVSRAEPRSPLTPETPDSTAQACGHRSQDVLFLNREQAGETCGVQALG
jgi:hypothetical protein